MKRTLLISDIHGEFILFEELLKKVAFNEQEDQLVLLGDYIDRGPSSKDVLNKVAYLKSKGARVLMGNHEQIMLDIFKNQNKYDWDFWLYTAGGLATMRSYGFSQDDLDNVNELEEFSLVSFLTEEIIEHLEFIRHLDTVVEEGDFVFVHAGVDPNIPLKKNSNKTLLWIRDEFHAGYHGDKTVVFGHTPTPRLHHDKKNHQIYFGENRIIGIDGGASLGGQLNCLELPSQKVYFVQK